MLVHGAAPDWVPTLTVLGAPLGPALLAGILGLCSAAALCLVSIGRAPVFLEALRDFLIPAALTLASSAQIEIWQAPGAWSDLLRLSPLCAAFTAMAHILLVAISLGRKGRHPSLLAQVSLLAAPLAFNWLLLLQTPRLLQQMIGALPGGSLLAERSRELGGRMLVLAIFNAGTALALNALCIRILLREPRAYALLFVSAAFAGLTPLVADLGSTEAVAGLPAILGIAVAILAVALAQAGLWGQTFLMTGLLMDALKGRRPAGYWGARYYRDGLGKGAVYSALFLGLLFLVRGLSSSSLVHAADLAQPLLTHVALGALCMPLAKTILESFDGSRPFHSRLLDSALQPHLYLRGAIIGCGLYLIPVQAMILKTPGERFLLGALIGGLAYAGAGLVLDGVEMLQGLRTKTQNWRVFLNASLLGGFVGGAIAWYVDPAQSAIVLNKFRLYVTLHVNNPQDYVIYPLFSKWGAMNLGPHSGSARVLFNESVSGVINWSLAAPLFSVNFFFLTALFARSWTPVRLLVSRQGLIAVAEQTVRVLRWGLWMAPVIYSLLRISPDPTWYNQDGAIRTLAAIWQSFALTPEAFRSWSIETFLQLLAYDWVRIMIWFDHMGLRVATLVNLSFVGGDALDELMARFQGHAGRTRCIPEALRRFATWAPLLIPFFLPMGADWAHVWDGAEAIQKTGQGQASPLAVLVVLFAMASVTVALVRVRFRKEPTGDMCVACGLQRPGFRPADEIVLTNGVYTAVHTQDGRGYSRVFSSVRHGEEYDLTNRPTSRAHNAGKFMYLREDGNPPWSLGFRPITRDDVETSVEPTGPLSVRLTCLHRDIEAWVSSWVLPDQNAEIYRVRLSNMGKTPRRVELTTYREICLNNPNPQLRHPFYNRQHIATWFVPELQAVFARNRMIKSVPTAHGGARPSPEVYFHAAHIPDRSRTRLTGYQDSRIAFVGDGTLRDPAGLTAPPLGLEDRDLHYTFDPIASLRVSFDLEPGQMSEMFFADGYAPSAAEGSAMLRRVLGLDRGADEHPLKPSRASREIREPSLDEMLRPAGEGAFRFSGSGEELHLGWKTPRRWAHLMVNELGYGTLATNDGSFASFKGNSQQNALTPFAPDSMTTQDPGQVLYLRDTATGEVTSPTYIPFREKDADMSITFGLGHCVFRKTRGEIATELTAFVLHDQPMEARLLRIVNSGQRPVTYDVTFFAQIILADVPIDSVGQIVAEEDREAGALFFNRPENRFQHGWAFVCSSLPCTAAETVLNRFMGAGRTVFNPVMVAKGRPDPQQEDDGYRVAALSGSITVPAGGEACMHVLLGQAPEQSDCRRLMAAMRRTEDLLAALERTKDTWRELLGTIRIETNSPAFDRLVNIWLPYQALTARLWGRLGPQQRSGAFGFRDQLQDVLPLTMLRPHQARAQILLHARQQFLRGDVLQWWHQTWDERTGLGIRNRASDPHLWLAYMTCRYVEISGDRSILTESIPFLEGPAIPRGQEGIAFVPRQSRDRGTLLEHCLRAVDLTLERLGDNGLPLMGAHDWNDGLSALGVGGKGTSVWLGFFLHDVLRTIAPLVEERFGQSRADRYRARAARLREALEGMWQGDHYARAVSDRGEIIDYADALCSAWPLLSGAADPERGQTALLTGLSRLEKENMVLLLTPSFDESSTPYPGRIADYPPGVRENGGQYSHGSSWLVDALTVLAGRASRAGDAAAAARWRRDALRVWLKISPLGHARADELAVFGLPPHQQPADIFHGPGYEGRGGWSWYTGAAARMLWAAYGLLGIGMRDGKPELDTTVLEADGVLQVRKVWMHGKEVFVGKDEDENNV
jgi:cyclic beta-1,2-glucan synthetase